MTTKEVIEYLKDNPHGYWFKRKIYGWGWVPVKWQGWLMIVIFVALLIWNAMSLDSATEPTAQQVTWFFVKEVFLIAVLIFICYKKGEKPKWQWGLPKKDINNFN